MEKDLALIQRYIRGDCTDSERIDLEERLSSDDDFKSLYEQERVVTIGIGLAERDRLKGILKKEKKATLNVWYAVAAGIIPLIVAGYFLFFSQPNHQGLFDDYYEPYGVYEFGQERGGQSIDSLESVAFDAYVNGKYEQALRTFDLLIDSSAEEGYIFYRAMCSIELDQLNVAKENFSNISTGSKYWQQSQWYLALIYLKEGDRDQCKKILNVLAEKQGGVAKRARSLLEEF